MDLSFSGESRPIFKKDTKWVTKGGQCRWVIVEIKWIMWVGTSRKFMIMHVM
jgi:hypothetical protein